MLVCLSPFLICLPPEYTNHTISWVQQKHTLDLLCVATHVSLSDTLNHKGLQDFCAIHLSKQTNRANYILFGNAISQADYHDLLKIV